MTEISAKKNVINKTPKPQPKPASKHNLVTIEYPYLKIQGEDLLGRTPGMSEH
jgi:hypothetical protein